MLPGPLKISVVASALTTDPHRVARLSRRMGFAGLLLDAGWSALEIPALSATGRRELRRLFASESQELVGLGADIGPAGFGPGADVDRALDQLEPVMQAAAALSAPLVCLDLGPLPQRPPPPRPKPPINPDLLGAILMPASVAPPPPDATPNAADSAQIAQIQSALQELGSRADRLGVTLSLRCELSSLASLEAALNEANCPWFFVDLDPVALLRDQWTIDEAFSALGSRIRHVRARDALVGMDRRTRAAPIGGGATDWPRLLADLDSADFHGWFTIDPTDLPNRPQAAAAGLAALRSIASR
jgi:sugar phosphate isomerase/epimerase